MKPKQKLKLPDVAEIREIESAEDIVIPKVYRDVVTEELAKYRKSGADKNQLNEIKLGIKNTIEKKAVEFYSDDDIRANMRLIAIKVLGDIIDLHERTACTRIEIEKTTDISEKKLDRKAIEQKYGNVIEVYVLEYSLAGLNPALADKMKDDIFSSLIKLDELNAKNVAKAMADTAADTLGIDIYKEYRKKITKTKRELGDEYHEEIQKRLKAM